MVKKHKLLRSGEPAAAPLPGLSFGVTQKFPAFLKTKVQTSLCSMLSWYLCYTIHFSRYTDFGEEMAILSTNKTSKRIFLLCWRTVYTERHYLLPFHEHLLKQKPFLSIELAPNQQEICSCAFSLLIRVKIWRRNAFKTLHLFYFSELYLEVYPTPVLKVSGLVGTSRIVIQI